MEIDLFQLGQLFGSLKSNFYMHALAWLILADLFTGYWKAKKFKRINSSVGLFGLCKHSCVFVGSGVIMVYGSLAGFGNFASGIVVFIIYNYAWSLTENLDTLGVPLPRTLVDLLDSKKRELDKTYNSKEETK